MSNLTPFPNNPIVNNNIKEATERLILFLSTKSYTDFRLDNILSTYFDDISNEFWVNPANPKFIEFISLPKTIEYIHGSNTVTAASFQIYKTTSLWWLIVSCSRFLHPHQIPRGEHIMLPDIMSIMTLLKEKVESNVGKIVII